MVFKGAVILGLVLLLLLVSCEEGQITGGSVADFEKALTDLKCPEIRNGLYEQSDCNGACKACKKVETSLKTCYECVNASLEETQYISCWNGGVFSTFDTSSNRTRFPFNHSNLTSSTNVFCVDDCPPDHVCDPLWCQCVKQPDPKNITCDKIKQKANNQPLSSRPNCDGRCPPNLCRAYNIAQFGLTCYACVQPECPPPTMRLQECMLTCSRGGQCMPRLQVGSAACYSCDPVTETPPTERVVTQPNWDKYHPEDQVVTQPMGDQERVTTPRPVDCNKYCQEQGMQLGPADYSAYIRSYLQSYSCVSGARISIRTRSYQNCQCYPQQPEITVDTTTPICKGTPCGDVACGQSTQCSCGERCTRTVSCDWGGWKIGATSAVPIVGAQAD